MPEEGAATCGPSFPSNEQCLRLFSAAKMGRKCFVPNCNTGYKTCKEKFHVFKAPNDETRLEKWRKAIPRADRVLTNKDFVCSRHFVNDDVITRWRPTSNGQILHDVEVRARLKDTAVPVLFQDCPFYLSKKVKARKPPANRQPVHVPQVKRTSPSQNSVNSLTFAQLKDSAKNLSMPTGEWGVHVSSGTEGERVLFCSVQCKGSQIIFTKGISFQETLKWDASACGKPIEQSAISGNANIPKSLKDVEILLKALDQLAICHGGPLIGEVPTVYSETAYVDQNFVWRHKKCKVLTDGAKASCIFCRTLKYRLKAGSVQKGKCSGKLRLILSPSKASKIKALRYSRKLCNKKLNYKNQRMTILKGELKTSLTKLQNVDNAGLSDIMKDVPDAQQLLIRECLNSAKKVSKNARRYTGEWLLLCLLLFIRSRSTYNFLRNQQLLPLPCVSTIQKSLSVMEAKCGFDTVFLEAFKKKISQKPEVQRHGILLFDEMQVRKSLYVKSKEMTYTGLVDFGYGFGDKGNQMADHALVFMFQPFADSWVQPIAVFASKGPTRSVVLTQLLIRAILLLETCGAIVDAVVCDGAATNRGIWKDLGISGELGKEQSSFIHPFDINRKVFMFSDAPHLIKCIRNRLLTKQRLKIGGKCIFWSYYENLYQEQVKLPANLRVCPKITAAHIKPTNTEKMKVKLATQIFSNSVADGLKFYMARNNCLFNGAEATVDFTLRLNTMFDALNRKVPREGIKNDSKDLAVLKECVEWLNEWEHGSTDAECFLTESTAEGLRVTLLSTLNLTDYLLNSCDFSYVLTAKLNQDALERFFGNIRQAGRTNDHPSMPTFLQLYRMLSMYSLLRPPKFGNCSVTETQTKPGITFQEFHEVFRTPASESKLESLKKRLDGYIFEGEWECDDVIESDYDMAEVKDCVVYYVTGFVTRHFMTTDCDVCRNALSSTDGQRQMPLAQLTETKTRGKLIHPNVHLFSLLSTAEQCFSLNAERPDVYDMTIEHVLSSNIVDFPCSLHKDEVIPSILHYYIMTRMRQYCRQKNILCGRETQMKRKLSKICSNKTGCS